MELVVWITEKLQLASFLTENGNRDDGERAARPTISRVAGVEQSLESLGGVGCQAAPSRAEAVTSNYSPFAKTRGQAFLIYRGSVHR
jgi:hypothetical protein